MDSITLSSQSSISAVSVNAGVLVGDVAGNPISGVTVAGAWSGVVEGAASGSTAAGGVIASLGGILLTFLAGAEVDRHVMREKSRESFLIGSVSFPAPCLGTMFVCRYLLHWDWTPSRLAGIALSTTSLAVVCADRRILSCLITVGFVPVLSFSEPLGVLARPESRADFSAPLNQESSSEALSIVRLDLESLYSKWLPDDGIEREDKSLFKAGIGKMRKHEYPSARKDFQSLINAFPDSRLSVKGVLCRNFCCTHRIRLKARRG